jgi:asparagine synthetase B (glutamine-hydrolysing)
VNNIDKPERAYLDIVSIFNEKERDALLNGAVSLDNGLTEYFEERNLVDGLLTTETKQSLPDNLLMKVDKTTMAAPVEARTPLLSEYVTDLMQQMPSTYKLRGGTDKYLFRQAMKDLLPGEISMREKQRFFVPIHNWIRDEIGDFVWEKVDAGVRHGHFDRRSVERIDRKFEQSPIYYARQLWCMLNFELWHEEFIQVDQ